MKVLILIIGLACTSLNCFSQDIIIRTNGERMNCKIISVDSVKAYFTYWNGKMDIETCIDLSKIEKIIYENKVDTQTITPDSIFIKKESGMTRYYHSGVLISKRELKGLLNLNQLAKQELKKVQGANAAAVALVVAGGALIAWPIILHTTKSYKEPKWSLAGAGGVLILLAIPVSLSSRPHLHNAIDLYNDGINKTSLETREVLIGFTTNGIGIRFVF